MAFESLEIDSATNLSTRCLMSICMRRSVNAPLYKVTGNWATNGLSARPDLRIIVRRSLAV